MWGVKIDGVTVEKVNRAVIFLGCAKLEATQAENQLRTNKVLVRKEIGREAELNFVKPITVSSAEVLPLQISIHLSQTFWEIQMVSGGFLVSFLSMGDEFL